MNNETIDAVLSDIEVENYVDDYSEEGLWSKIKEIQGSATRGEVSKKQ